MFRRFNYIYSRIKGEGVSIDSLPEDEIEAIWSRIKAYIDTANVKSITMAMIKDEIESEMRSPSKKSVPSEKEIRDQSTMDFLIEKGFPKEASENIKISNEILGSRIKQITVRDAPRFQIAKGTPTVDGVKAGQFISGKTKDEAIKSLTGKVQKLPKPKPKGLLGEEREGLTF